MQHLVIAVAESLESQLKSDLHAHQRIATLRIQMAGFLFVSFEQVFGHGRHQRPRQQVGRQHGEHHSLRQRHEQVAGHSGQEEHGHEHDADGQRGNKGGHRNLLGAIQNRFLNFLSFGNVPVDVLNLDRRIVHQDADCERQPTQRHDVDGLAQRAHDDNRGKNRERNGDGDDQRAAPASEENQNHDRR